MNHQRPTTRFGTDASKSAERTHTKIRIKRIERPLSGLANIVKKEEPSNRPFLTERGKYSNHLFFKVQ